MLSMCLVLMRDGSLFLEGAPRPTITALCLLPTLLLCELNRLGDSRTGGQHGNCPCQVLASLPSLPCRKPGCIWGSGSLLGNLLKVHLPQTAPPAGSVVTASPPLTLYCPSQSSLTRLPPPYFLARMQPLGWSPCWGREVVPFFLHYLWDHNGSGGCKKSWILILVMEELRLLRTGPQSVQLLGGEGGRHH